MFRYTENDTESHRIAQNINVYFKTHQKYGNTFSPPKKTNEQKRKVEMISVSCWLLWKYLYFVHFVYFCIILYISYMLRAIQPS